MKGNAMKTHTTVLAALMASVALLAGCDRRAANDSDPVVARGERSDAPVRDMRDAQRDLPEAAANAGDSMIDKTRDAAISAQVNARLARDSDLSALGIDVDTAGGRVVLHGTAPDTAARDRATVLARGVDGVVSVDNELRVEPRK
jgi:hyperosmotically inducible periplasmic protein